jgi:hypothetical protein
MVVQLLCSGDLASGSDDDVQRPPGQHLLPAQLRHTTYAGHRGLPPARHGGHAVHWDSSACGDSGGGRVASGHIGEDTLGLPFGQVPEDDDLVRFLFGGYSIRESPCAGARMMTFSVDPHAPSTLLDRSGAILGHALADEAGSVVFPRVPETSDPAWLISGEGPPMVVGPPTQGPEGNHS